MRTVLLALLTGFICGAVFTLLRLPIPAPPTLAGIAGIVGVFLGLIVVGRFIGGN